VPDFAARPRRRSPRRPSTPPRSTRQLVARPELAPTLAPPDQMRNRSRWGSRGYRNHPTTEARSLPTRGSSPASTSAAAIAWSTLQRTRRVVARAHRPWSLRDHPTARSQAIRQKLRIPQRRVPPPVRTRRSLHFREASRSPSHLGYERPNKRGPAKEVRHALRVMPLPRQARCAVVVAMTTKSAQRSRVHPARLFRTPATARARRRSRGRSPGAGSPRCPRRSCRSSRRGACARPGTRGCSRCRPGSGSPAR
jgi:hypothetical protein